MKWFKHLSDLPQDEGISRYLDAAERDRVAAYGFLMFVLESIASRMDANKGHLVCSATYSITHWGRITYSHPNRVRKYLGLCEVIGWVHVGFDADTCEVSVPRMVEWRDEHTRKLGVTPEKIAQSRQEEIRKEKRENKGNPALSESFSKEQQRLGHSVTAGFDIFWSAYPKKVKRKPAKLIWQRVKPDTDVLVADIANRLENDAQWKSGFIPDPTTYLNGERWNDELTEAKNESHQKRPNEFGTKLAKIRERAGLD